MEKEGSRGSVVTAAVVFVPGRDGNLIPGLRFLFEDSRIKSPPPHKFLEKSLPCVVGSRLCGSSEGDARKEKVALRLEFVT